MRVEERAAQVRLLVLDVDGVLTDGGLYYDPSGQVMKRFHVHDGLGIKLAQQAGLRVAVVTGLDSPAVETRIRELGVEEYHAGRARKAGTVRDLATRNGLRLEQLAFLGDDWVDAAPMRLVGMPMAVADAQPEIKRLAAWISEFPGGRGAVRDAVRFLLAAQGTLGSLWDRMAEE